MTAVDTRPPAPTVDWQERALAAEERAREAENLLNAVLDAVRTELERWDRMANQLPFRMAANWMRDAIGRLNPEETS